MTRLEVGIDPSTQKIAIAGVVTEPRLSFAKSYELKKKSKAQDPASLGRAIEAMADFAQWADQVAPDGVRVAWVESPLVGRGGVTATVKQAYVGGIIRGALANAGFLVYDVNVSTWKKAVTGNGRAEYPAIRQAVFSYWPKVRGLVGDDDDLVAAAAIRVYGSRLHESKSPVRGNAKPSRGGVQARRPRSVVRKARVRRGL